MDHKEEVGKIRLFVGGLASGVSAVDLKERFAPLGTVLSVAIPSAKYGSHRGFAYVDFLPSSEASLKKLISSYNGCKWRGGLLRIEQAKQHYVDKLQKEWTAEAEALAAEEAERNRKDEDVPVLAAPKQPKSWPLMLLEQPEKPDKWKKKRDFEQGAEVDGVKLFFPSLKKLKTVPSRGLGKHKRSFQRVESLPVNELSTCDCEKSLRTGSCDCSKIQSGYAREDLASIGEDEAVSMEIAKERQRQLDLLSRMFPSDSPRKSKVGKEFSTTSPSTGVEVKKSLSSVGTDKKMVPQIDAPQSPQSPAETGEDRMELIRPPRKEEPSKFTPKAAEEKISEPAKVSQSPPEEQEMEEEEPEICEPAKVSQSPPEEQEVEEDEPEMWLSFMDTTPLPEKREDKVSEFELDELELMLSEDEEESEEEEEALEPIPEAPKKKAKRKKKKGKKSKQLTTPSNEPKSSVIGADEVQIGLKRKEGSPSPSGDEADVTPPESENGDEAEVTPPESENGDEAEVTPPESENGSRLEKAAPMAHKDEGENQDGPTFVKASSRMTDERLDPEPADSTMWDSDEGSESAEDEAELSEDEFFLGGTSSEDEISEEETENAPPIVEDRDEYFVGATSSDESLDSEPELDLWVSGIDETERAPLSGKPVAAVVSTKQSKKDPPKPRARRSTSEKTPRDFSKDKPVDSGQAVESAPSFIDPVVAVGSPEAEKNLPNPAALESTSQDNAAELFRSIPVGENHVAKQEQESSLEIATTVPPSSKTEVAAANGSEETEAPAPKRNELTRATWKSLVGETGRVVFSLQQLTGAVLPPATTPRDETPAAEDTPMEEISSRSDPIEGNDHTKTSLATNQPDRKKQGAFIGQNMMTKSVLATSEVDAPPQIHFPSDSGVCSFMKSPNAEKEWLATKSDLRTDYRSKHKQAVKKSKKLRGK
ncbi:nucleolar protein 8 [Marchantia polymorpha subsp. ruderalis]|uniref:RRM domain-containing protein n=2 Tax=Marchantia polymorpha TaxID=3197 RepID=A0AAF6BBI2_MARPO|nr:hypothetical protein MARPO_0169s0023 [Marchantia polymorpha]BBN09366.1 hypothetical protein Mp_4g19210 [Marchantia polymorpha subsp. ruderalis]|eukprot:PTQ28263.1 hypothetical protein MARPO_0169s0023 [Marchantia polymorpha]